MKDRKKDIQDNIQPYKRRPYTRPEIMLEEKFEPEVDTRRSPVKCLRRPAQGGGCRFIPRV